MAGAEGGIVDTPVHSLPMVAVCAGPAELAPIPYLYTPFSYTTKSILFYYCSDIHDVAAVVPVPAMAGE